MATIETQVLAEGLSHVEDSWQKYMQSQTLAEGLSGQALQSALAVSARHYTHFQNQSQQFYAEVRKRVDVAEKLERDKKLYPHYFTEQP